MKKVLFSLSMMAVLIFAGQSCKKASAEDNIAQTEDYQGVDGDESYEIEAPDNDDVDIIGYEPEAVTTTVTGGTKCTLSEDPDNSCDEFKYAKPSASASWEASHKVGKTGVTYTVVLAGLPVGSSRVDSIVNTNSSTGTLAEAAKVTKVGGHLLISNVTPDATDTSKVTFKLATETDEFKAGSASCKIYWHVTKAGVSTVKYKSVTIKVVGLSASGKTFGTQRWGYDFLGGNASKYTATPTAIDTVGVGNFVPAIGTIVCFGPSKRGVVDSVSITDVVAADTPSRKAKGKKCYFRYKMYNYKCTSAMKTGKVTTYSEVMPVKELTTGGLKLTGFVQ